MRTIPAPQPAASAATIAAELDEHGYAIIRGLLPPPVVDGARAALARLTDARIARFLAEGRLRRDHADLPFATRLIAVADECRDAVPPFFREDLHVAEFFDLLLAPRLLDLAGAVVGPEIRIYPNYMARPKLPDDHRMLIGWHQDAAYTHAFRAREATPAEALRTLNCWTPLLPARRENGCMQFIPRSHRLGLAPYHVHQEMHLVIDDAALAPHLDAAVDIELDPGDVVVFHNLLYHRGLPNRSPTIRWSVDWRFQDATQPTLRPQAGHLVRSAATPAAAIVDRAAWAAASFA